MKSKPKNKSKKDKDITSIKNRGKERLGKGLSALISSGAMDGEGYKENFNIDFVEPNPYQPRMDIDPDELIELADSIREHGVIQPLLITRSTESSEGNKFYLIAGERRYRAAKLAGLEEIPVVIKESSPQQMLELALIENIQRQDLNSLEEAFAFEQLSKEFGLTHKEIAKKVGLSRVAVTNKLRLTALPITVKEYILNGQLSEGHGRALLGISDESSLLATANIVVKRDLNVRDTENLVRKINYGRSGGEKKRNMVSSEEKEIVDMISDKIGSKVKLKKMKKGGKLVIRYKDEEELQNLAKFF